MTDQSIKRFAAIRLDGNTDINLLLENVVQKMQADNFRVQGYLQKEIMKPDRCQCDTYLENLANGAKLQISQDLGNGAKGCKLDNSMLVQLSEIALKDLDEIPELLIVNRFGRSEAEGHGFRQVIEKAFGLGIPILTAVKDLYLEDWRKFSGELGLELAADESEIITWVNSMRIAIQAESRCLVWAK